MKKKRLGIFDIDGTIFRWSLFIELFNALIEEGIFPQEAYERVKDSYYAWLDRRLHYDKYLETTIQTYFKYLKGCKEEKFHKIAKQIITHKKDRVYIFTRDLAKKLKKEGYFLLIISASPVFIVREFAHYLEFDKYFGTEYEIKNGVFTGKLIDMAPVKNKGEVFKRFLRESPFNFNLENSIAVGDTEADIAYLGEVGNPIAFNPDFVLMQYAKKRGWRIVIESKDIIYDLKNFKVIKKL